MYKPNFDNTPSLRHKKDNIILCLKKAATLDAA